MKVKTAKLKKTLRLMEKNKELLEEAESVIYDIRESFCEAIGNDDYFYRQEIQIDTDPKNTCTGCMQIKPIFKTGNIEMDRIGEFISMFTTSTHSDPWDSKEDKNLGLRFNQASFEYMRVFAGGDIEKYLDSLKFNYYSEGFRRLRLNVFQRDGEICAKCGAIPKAGTSLTIDHIKPVSKYPDLAMDEDNLQVLCWECNTKKSNIHNTDYRKKQ